MPEPDPVEQRIRAALREVLDPEAGMNIVDMGLIYGIERAQQRVHVRMTMTTRACPMGAYLTDRVKAAAQQAWPDGAVDVELVWDPPWDVHMMSDYARKHFGWS